MSNPTSNFGWQMPTATDLVTDLPADFEVFGQAVDTSLADLKGGTTGQVLKKNTNADMDFVWAADSAGMTNPMTTTGDTIYSSSGSTPARLGIGSTGQVLTVAAGVPSWAAPAGALTIAQIATGTLTSGSELSLTGLSAYDTLEFRISGLNIATDDLLGVRINSNSGNNYEYNAFQDRANGSFSANDPATKQQLSDNEFNPMDANLDSGITTNQFRVRFTNCKSAGFTLVSGSYVYRYDAGGGNTRAAISLWTGIYKVAEAVSSIQFRSLSGYTFSAGSYTIWGG